MNSFIFWLHYCQLICDWFTSNCSSNLHCSLLSFDLIFNASTVLLRSVAAMAVLPNWARSSRARYKNIYCFCKLWLQFKFHVNIRKYKNQITNDWTRKFRWWRISQTTLKMDTWPSSSSCCINESRATKVPVRPTPALQWTKMGPRWSEYTELICRMNLMIPCGCSGAMKSFHTK